MANPEHFTPYLEYNPEDGLCRWKVRPVHRGGKKIAKTQIGRIAGSPDRHGHIRIGLFGKKIGAHQLGWFIINGHVPDGYEIDHINGDPSDNRLCNLRLATHAQNLANARKRTVLDRKYKGIVFIKRTAKWYGQVSPNGKMILSKPFDTEEEAAMAYDDMARECYGEFARLNFPVKSGSELVG